MITVIIDFLSMSFAFVWMYSIFVMYAEYIYIYYTATSSTQWLVCELDRYVGWRSGNVLASIDIRGFLWALEFCVNSWGQPNTFHCRCLVLALADVNVHFDHLWDGLPAFSPVLYSKSTVCEVSLAPVCWAMRLMRELTNLGGSCWMQWPALPHTTCTSGTELMALEREI